MTRKHNESTGEFGEELASICFKAVHIFLVYIWLPERGILAGLLLIQEFYKIVTIYTRSTSIDCAMCTRGMCLLYRALVIAIIICGDDKS